MKKIRRALILVLATVILTVTPLAATIICEADITVVEDGTAGYDMTSIIASADVDFLVSDGFITSTGLDTRVVKGGTEVPHMLADDKVLFADAVGISTTNLYTFQTGQSALTEYQIILGGDGYITTTDDASLELGDDFIIEYDGYIDTTIAADKFIVNKNSAFTLQVLPDLTNQGHIGEFFFDEQDFTGNGSNQDVWRIGDNLFAVIYEGPGASDGRIMTFTMDDDGVISAPIDDIQFADDYGHWPRLTPVVGTDIYFIQHKGASGHGYGKTVNIDSDGNIGGVLDGWKFKTTSDSHWNCVHVSGTVYALSAEQQIMTFHITSDGTLPSVDGLGGTIDWRNLATGYLTQHFIYRANGNYFMVTGNYSGGAKFETWYVADNGVIGGAVADSFSIADSHIDQSIELSPGYFATPLTTSGDDYITTYSISGSGIFTEDIDTQVYSANAQSTLYCGTLADDIRWVHWNFSNEELQTWEISDVGIITNTMTDSWAYPDDWIGETLGFLENGKFVIVGYENTFSRLEAFSFGVLTGTGIMAQITGGALVIANDIPSGEHTIIVEADGSDLTITIDGVDYETKSLAATPVPDNINAYTMLKNDVAPYTNYLTIDVSDLEMLRYQPVDIISGTVLPDTAGTAQNGAITWGANPSGLTATFGSLICETTGSGAAGQTTINPSPLGVHDPGDYVSTTPDSRTMPGTPIDPLIVFMSDTTGFGLELSWGIFILAMMIIGFAVPFGRFQSITWGGVGASAVLGIFVSMGALDPLFLILIPIMIIGCATIDQRTSWG